MTQRKLIIEIDNRTDLDLADFAASLAAIGDQYKKFVTEQGGVRAEARLFVHKVREGSLVAELVDAFSAAQYVYEHRDYIAPFHQSLTDILKSVLQLSPPAYKLDPRTVRNARAIAQPVASSGGNQMNFVVNDGVQITNNWNFNGDEAALIAHHSNHLLNSKLPEEHRFTNEPMSLFQMRDAPPGKAGDMGTIDRFAEGPKKILFASDALKSDILHHQENPFEMVFWVSGIVKTTGGKVVGYELHDLHDVTPRDEQ